jgi:DNA-binding transcriptional MerR regulator
LLAWKRRGEAEDRAGFKVSGMAEQRSSLSLVELSRLAGLPGRTIRFYIAQGLLSGPDKAGRGAVYGQGHLQRLAEIGRLQDQRLTLREIAGQLAGRAEEVSASEPTVWWKYRVTGDVEVQVRGDAAPWRVRMIRKELSRLAAALQAAEKAEDL